MKWVFVKDKFWKYFSLIQLLVAPVSIKALHTGVPILVGKVVHCSDLIITSSVQFVFGLRLSDTSSIISVLSDLSSILSCSVCRKGISDCLDSHWSLSVKQFSLSSHSISLSWVASESYSSFNDSSSIACNSFVISYISTAVCFALSCSLPLRLLEGLTKVVTTAVILATFFFTFSGGLTPFPFLLIFLSCPIGATFVVCGPWFNLLHHDRLG